MIFVHIGAGAGDQDESEKFRDGFSELVKNYKSKNKEIFVVEANKNHRKLLKKCWKNYKKTKFFFYAIVPNKNKKKNLTLYYSVEDAPFYQKLSFDIDHVRKIYPNTIIKKMKIKTLKIKDFMKRFLKKKIDYFSIDIEGLDYDIIMDIDFKKINISNFSFEHRHLSKEKMGKIINKLTEVGYSYNGFGVDHNNQDWTFKKKINNWNNMVVSVMRFFHRKRYKHFNKLIFKL